MLLAPPYPGFKTVTEFYHPMLNHYQLAADAAEIEALLSDGWVATGDSFRALAAPACYGSLVFRFTRNIAQRRGSRFLTVDAAECGVVRKSSPSWRPQDIPFSASAPLGGVCQAQYGTFPVYRAYNGREMFNDMNHRYTTSLATYNDMIAQGWGGEGIAFCVFGR